MIKTIFFDVDGTLMSHTKRDIPESTKYALNALRKKGIQIVLATGRHMKELENLPISKISFDGYLLLNGQLFLNSDGKIIHGYPLRENTLEILMQEFTNKSFPLLLVEENSLYINYINDYVKIAQASISTPLPKVKESTGSPVYQAIAFVDDSELQELKKRIPDVSFTRWNDYAVDIISKGGGKEVAIQTYMTTNHLSKDEVMAFGDGENDIGMLQTVGIGIAMGNASTEVQQYADYITDDVDHDGILNALKHFNIL